jgi:hypothetical protein
MLIDRTSGVPSTWTPRYEVFADISIPAGARYVPAVAGLFSVIMDLHGEAYYTWEVAYYSSRLAKWVRNTSFAPGNGSVTIVGDGANLAVVNTSTYARDFVILCMR